MKSSRIVNSMLRDIAVPIKSNKRNKPRFPFPNRHGLRPWSNIVRPVLLCAAILNGCTLGPDFTKPEAPIADQWVQHKDPAIEQQPSVDYSEWWKVFGDPVLSSLVEKAFHQNLNLQIAGLRILEARAQLGIAIGNQYPQNQQLTGNAIYTTLSKNGPNMALADRHIWDFRLGFDAAWELDFWGRFRRGVEAAQANLGASLTNYDDILVSLTAEVAAVYIGLRTLEERLEIALNNVAIQKRSYEIADIRYRNGAVTQLDPMQALTLLKNTEATIPALEAGIKQTKFALSTLLGMPPAYLDDLLVGAKKIPPAPEILALGIPADLLRRRPDVRFAELQAAAQSARIGISRTQLFPRFILLGSVGFNSSDNGGIRSNGAHLSDLFSPRSFTWFVGPTVEWNILNYGRIKNDVRVQDARLQELIVNYQQSVLTAAREVEEGIAGFLGAQSEVHFLKDSVGAAQRAVEIAEIQYRDGAVDYIRVLNTQQALVQQQDILIQRKGRIDTSLISVYKALGGGWELRNGRPVVTPAAVKEMGERTDWGDLLETEMPKQLPEPPPTGTEQPLLNKIDY
ncbi:MAG: efflux transporter outer membrane subunit [Gammaproteobacteria bacterium]